MPHAGDKRSGGWLSGVQKSRKNSALGVRTPMMTNGHAASMGAVAGGVMEGVVGGVVGGLVEGVV